MGQQGVVLGQLAVQHGFITDEQLTECLGIQASMHHSVTLGDVFRMRGYVSVAAMTRLGGIQRQILEGGQGASRRPLFGKVGLDKRIFKRVDLYKGVRLQTEKESQGVQQRLGIIMVNARLAGAQQVRLVLREQGLTVGQCAKCASLWNMPMRRALAPSCPACQGAVRDDATMKLFDVLGDIE